MMGLRIQRQGLLPTSVDEMAEHKAADVYQMVIATQLLFPKIDFSTVEDCLSNKRISTISDKDLLTVVSILSKANAEDRYEMQSCFFLPIQTIIQMYPNIVDLLISRLVYRVYTNGVCHKNKPLAYWYEAYSMSAIIDEGTNQAIKSYIAKWDSPKLLNGAMSNWLATKPS